jgi:ATP-dependent RNA helicase DDX41
MDFFSNKKFTELSYINQSILNTMNEQEMTYMTNAQSKCFQNILANKQTLNLAETGSGKTLMYLLPIINEIYSKDKNCSQNGSQMKGALIITSTKELCNQIYRDIKMLDSEGKVNVTRLGSISSITPLIRNYDKIKENKITHDVAAENLSNYVNFDNMDIVISTPEQMDSLVKFDQIKQLNPKYLVIDEADHLLTESSKQQSLASLFSHMDLGNSELLAQRNIILTAATFPERVKSSSQKEFLKKYFPNIKICKSDNYLKYPQGMDHTLVDVDNQSFKDKLHILKGLVNTLDSQNFLIFCNSNKNIIKIHQFLSENGVKTLYHSSDSTEAERNKNINLFSTGSYTALICSDAINRGIHFDFPLEIIQFDTCENPTNLIHRIGRTGRLGAHSKLTSMINKKTQNLLAHIQSKTSKHSISF